MFTRFYIFSDDDNYDKGDVFVFSIIPVIEMIRNGWSSKGDDSKVGDEFDSLLL